MGLAAGFAAYVLAVLIQVGYFVAILPEGSMGPSLISSFLSMVMSPASYPIPIIAGIVVAIVVIWRMK